MAELFVDLDMHRIGKAVAGVVARRDFKDAPIAIKVTAQDPEARRTPRNAQRRRDIGPRWIGLNILRHARHADSGELFKLLKYRPRIGINPVNDRREIMMQKSFGQRNRIAASRRFAKPAKPEPLPTRDEPQLFGIGFGQAAIGHARELIAAVTRILQQFADVRKWLMQRPAARRRRLNDRARPAFASNQPFTLKRAQSLSHREPRHAIFCTQNIFGRKIAVGIGPLQDRRTQVISEFEVTRLSRALLCCRQSVSPRAAIA